MDVVENMAWKTACSLTPSQLMNLYDETGEISDFHRETFKSYAARGKFSSVNQMFYFYADAIELHEAAYLVSQLEP